MKFDPPLIVIIMKRLPNVGNPAVSIFIPRRKGGYLATQRVGLSTLDIFESGRVMPLVKLIEDGLVLNDGKCDASGRLWVGKNVRTFTTTTITTTTI